MNTTIDDIITSVWTGFYELGNILHSYLNDHLRTRKSHKKFFVTPMRNAELRRDEISENYTIHTLLKQSYPDLYLCFDLQDYGNMVSDDVEMSAFVKFCKNIHEDFIDPYFSHLKNLDPELYADLGGDDWKYSRAIYLKIEREECATLNTVGHGEPFQYYVRADIEG